MRKKVRGLLRQEKEILAQLEQSSPENEELNPSPQKYAANIVLDILCNRARNSQ